MAQAFPLVIVGGNNPVAPFLMKRLCDLGMGAEVISRKPVATPEGFTFNQMDFTKARNWIAPENAVIVSLLPMPVLAQFLPRFIGIKSMVAVLSASYVIKAKSPNLLEQSNARSISLAEGALRSWCVRSNVQHTLLRGTMIYDCDRDYNVMRMARFIKRYHFLPLAAPASGLRQPIHADDVAKAVVAALDNPLTFSKALNIAGGEVLTYRAMAERIFKALGQHPRCWMIETGFLKKAVEFLSQTSILQESFFSSAVFDRMNEDHILDVEEGLRLLNYQPRDFRPEFPTL